MRYNKKDMGHHWCPKKTVRSQESVVNSKQ